MQPFTSFKDRLDVLEKIVDCYYNIVVRLLMRDKIEKAESILANVFATIEKIEPGEKNLTHGLILRHDLSRLKILRAELCRQKGKGDIRIEAIEEIIKTGYEVSCETFRNLLKKKDLVQYFFTNLECLAYFCYFSIGMENVSQTFQFATVIKGLVETFIKKINTEDKNNLLVEVMIFCKKYQIAKEQRFELYHLLVVTLVLYSSALYQTEQRQKSTLFLDKVLYLLQTIEPEGTLIPVITNLKVTYQSQSEKKSLAQSVDNYQINVIDQMEENTPQDHSPRDSSAESGDEQNKDLRATKKRKKIFSKNKTKLNALTNGLFIPGFQDGKISEDTLKKFSDTWAVKAKKEKEVSMKQTLNKEYEKLQPALQDHDLVREQKAAPVRAQQRLPSGELSQTSLKLDVDNNQGAQYSIFKKQKDGKGSQRRASISYSNKKAFVRPGTATFGAGKSLLTQSLAGSKQNSMEVSKAAQDDRAAGTLGKSSISMFKTEKKGSMIFVDNKREITQGLELSDEEKNGKKKPKSIAKQLQSLLYKADLKEKMPDQYIFNTHKPPTITGARQSKWVHDRHTTKASDTSTGFSISKDWFYDRMMAGRLKEDEDRVLTNNTTMNIKNHQVMIEFKTGVHEEMPLPKKRVRTSNQQKEYLIKCSLTGSHKEALVKKGVPLGYLDHQIDERKKAYNDSLEVVSRPRTAMVSINHSRSQSHLHIHQPSADMTNKSQSRGAHSRVNIKGSSSQVGIQPQKSSAGFSAQGGGTKGAKSSEEQGEKPVPGGSKEDLVGEGSAA
jgi:hypothetical protein